VVQEKTRKKKLRKFEEENKKYTREREREKKRRRRKTFSLPVFEVFIFSLLSSLVHHHLFLVVRASKKDTHTHTHARTHRYINNSVSFSNARLDNT